jgi:hypothetical protein
MRPAHGVSSENKPQRAQRKKDQTHIVHLRPVFIHGRVSCACKCFANSMSAKNHPRLSVLIRFIRVPINEKRPSFAKGGRSCR